MYIYIYTYMYVERTMRCLKNQVAWVSTYLVLLYNSDFSSLLLEGTCVCVKANLVSPVPKETTNGPNGVKWCRSTAIRKTDPNLNILSMSSPFRSIRWLEDELGPMKDVLDVLNDVLQDLPMAIKDLLRALNNLFDPPENYLSHFRFYLSTQAMQTPPGETWGSTQSLQDLT